ncbi:MAG: CopG family DNA-binding protein [Candidatus Methanohalarchaeum thermophilum]|uniref:CopG family DNA-binding protein n=1 Tax=Methanohalarchaeum thermophilum TaxID=1903181 RepID=A0A1Q6DS75_METT1|nr:MAG: CopG family DNA-binding protein [Candidatus Methanohalarchaeum thermophilum]
MEDPATIQIEKETRKKLKELRITKRGTYDEILNRLMKNATDSKNKD